MSEKTREQADSPLEQFLKSVLGPFNQDEFYAEWGDTESLWSKKICYVEGARTKDAKDRAKIEVLVAVVREQAKALNQIGHNMNSSGEMAGYDMESVAQAALLRISALVGGEG